MQNQKKKKICLENHLPMNVLNGTIALRSKGQTTIEVLAKTPFLGRNACNAALTTATKETIRYYNFTTLTIIFECCSVNEKFMRNNDKFGKNILVFYILLGVSTAIYALVHVPDKSSK